MRTSWVNDHLEFEFFSVDDDGCDLLVHEDEDGCQHSRNTGYDACPPGITCAGNTI